MSKGRIKRGSVTTKKFEVGSQASITAKTKEDYDKINFRNKAIDSFNNITSRKDSPAGRRRKSATPFSNISGFGGFGGAPQLGSNPAYKQK
jgi:hypothetical protein